MVQMKPETIVKRTYARKIATEERTRDLANRLRILAERDGPDSIWPDLLKRMGE